MYRWGVVEKTETKQNQNASTLKFAKDIECC
jgi:hypothetical protein